MAKYFDGADLCAALRALICGVLALGLSTWHALARADGDGDGDERDHDGDDARIQVLSSAPHLVSGGSALVRVRPDDDVRPGAVKILAGGVERNRQVSHRRQQPDWPGRWAIARRQQH